MQYTILAPIDGVVAAPQSAGGRRRRARCCLKFGPGRALAMDKAVVTCAITGVLTDPKVYPAPVTPEQMAGESKARVR